MRLNVPSACIRDSFAQATEWKAHPLGAHFPRYPYEDANAPANLSIRRVEAQGVVRGRHKPSDTPSDLQRLASLKARPGPNHLFEGGGEPSRILFQDCCGIKCKHEFRLTKVAAPRRCDRTHTASTFRSISKHLSVPAARIERREIRECPVPR